jgi:hypothetical protein
VVVYGVYRSRSGRVWGAAPVDGFILSFGAGVYFDSNQRHSAMGLFQLRGRSSSSPTATAGEGDLELLLVAKDSGACL